MTTPSVSIEAVTKRFSGHTAVNRLSMEVSAGGIFGLLGPNGAGKSTTIRLIMGILEPDDGQVVLFGSPHSSRALSQRIGYLPEERGLYKKMKVLDHLIFLGETKGIGRADARKRAQSWLERLGVSDWAQKKVEDLSKGMQQKVQFAGALLHEPELVILDEPFSGLDPVNAQVMKDIVVAIAAEGRTVLFSTHVMEQAERMCDRIAIIARGEMVVNGTLAQVKEEFRRTSRGAGLQPRQGARGKYPGRSCLGRPRRRLRRHRRVADGGRRGSGTVAGGTGTRGRRPAPVRGGRALAARHFHCQGRCECRHRPRRSCRMKKIIAVIRREFVERVRTRAFVISTVLLPVFMAAMLVLPTLMMSGGDRTSRIVVVDASSTGLGQPISKALAAERIGDGAQAKARYEVQVVPAGAAQLAAVRDKLLSETGFSKKHKADGWDGVLVLTDDTLASGQAAYYGGNVGSIESMNKLQRAVSTALAGVRLGESGVDTALVRRAMAPARSGHDQGLRRQAHRAERRRVVHDRVLHGLHPVSGHPDLRPADDDLGDRGKNLAHHGGADFVIDPVPDAAGQGAGRGSGRPDADGDLGWFGVPAQQPAHALIGMFGMSADAMQSFPIPGMAPGLLVVFLLYFALGFLLYGALYAAIGAMCNTIQETQQYAIFVTMFIMVGFFAVFALIKDPTGGLGVTLSNIPFFAPFTMPVRWSLTSVPPLELALSLGLMVVALLACVWLAARIYRTGILMYGKKPSWGELWRWIRA